MTGASRERRPSGRRFFFLPLLALLVSCASTTPESHVVRPCRIQGTDEIVRCLDLLVPENPADPAGRRIKLHGVVVPALTPLRGAAPLFDLAGGPGLAATGGASFYLTVGRVHRQNRDVVLVDQRGTGESSPLRCPELEGQDPLARMYPPQAVQRCRGVLSQHADLAQYSTPNSVADLEAVRRALGYEKVDLFGLSYGTRLALDYIGKHPDRVRSAVLLGTVLPTAKMPLWHARSAQATLEAVLSDCRAAGSCGELTASGRGWPPSITGPVAEAFRGQLLSAATQSRIASLLAAMRNGDTRPFQTTAPGSVSSYAEGLYLSIVCAEDTNWIADGEIDAAVAGTFLGRYRVDEQIGACKIWDVPSIRLAPVERSNVPVLFLAGDRDYVAPVRWTEQIAGSFPRSRVVVVPRMGHIPDGLSNSECLDTMMAAFYENGPSAVDVSCVATMQPPPFAVP